MTTQQTPETLQPSSKRKRQVRSWKGFSKRLLSLKGAVEALEGFGPDFAYASPAMGPELSTWVVPAVDGGAVLGLSPQGNSQEPSRRGLGGMPSSAKKQIKRTLCLMEEVRSRLAFWTVSLPDRDYPWLLKQKSWPVFQRRLVDRLIQYLTLHGDPALVLAVVELGDKRSNRTGRPMPHIHIVCSGYGSRVKGTGTWLLSPGLMDQLVAEACRDAGLEAREREASSRIEPIRTSVRGYLTKYLRKGSRVEDLNLDDGWDALVPHQWWNRSAKAKALVDGHLFRLPPSFAAFVIQQRARLEQLGLGFARVVEVGRRKSKTVDRAIEALCFQWASTEALTAGVEWFSCWCSSPSTFEREADRCLDVAALARQTSSVDLTRRGV